jgi:serine protease Do/serine protease DegQ
LPAAGNQPLTTLAPVVKKVSPGVVSISTRGPGRSNTDSLFDDPALRGLFGLPEMPLQQDSMLAASGVVIDAVNGYIVTNHHVVENADEITVTFLDGRQVKAIPMGADPDTDIAVIKVPPGNLTAIPFGDSERLEVGDFVLSIGNPYGIGQTVTSGIVSALHRTQMGLEGYEEFIQTDASINPGSSGGALTNLRGELIGINTALVRANGATVGIGFAIPIHMVRSIADQLIKYGSLDRGELGFAASTLTEDLAREYRLPPNQPGAVVTHFEPSSAAQRAGLKLGDVITTLGGAAVRDAADLRNRIGMLRVGDTAEMTIVRGGKPLRIKAQLTLPSH